MPATDLKKVYKNVFSAKEDTLSIIDVPKFNYLSVNGEGHPNGGMFKDAVSDNRKTSPEKLKTIIRGPIAQS